MQISRLNQSNAIALAALSTLLGLTFLDNTIVSVALGSLQTDLKASVADLQWVVGGYALAFASAMLACGMIGDELGRKAVMLAGAGVFCAGSALCALAPNPQLVIAGRVVMGLGAAASEPGTLSVLRQLYPGERARARAVGVWAAVAGLALALGPVLGGLLAGAWSWRAIFWFNLLFGLVALTAAAVSVPESADPSAARVDTLGALLGAGTLATLTFAVIDAETAGFGAPVVVALLCAAVLLAAIFVIQERWAAHPVLDLRLFRLARFTVPNIVACCTCLATFAIFFFAALYLAEVPQDSGYRIALVFAPMAVLMIAASVIAGFWAGRAGPRWPVTVGCAAFAAGLLLASPQISPQPDYLVLSLALALAGTGIGTTVGPVTTAVLSAVPPERSGMAASAVNTSREVGAVAGVSVLGALVFSRLNATLSSHLAALNVPAGDKAAIMAFRPVIIQYIETGQAGAGGYARYGSIVGRVIGAAYAAFGDGLHAALYVSATIVIAAGITAAAALK